MKKCKNIIVFFSVILIVCVSCATGVEDVSKNTLPKANAGINQEISKRTTVTLDGSSSTGSEGNTNNLSYTWKQKSGTSVTLSSTNEMIVKFESPPLSGVLLFELVVSTKGGVSSNPSTTEINVINRSPVADAGGDRAIPFDSDFTISASNSSDIDNDKITYYWEYLGGVPGVEIIEPLAKSISILATNSKGKQLKYKLTVTDEEGATDSSIIILTVATSIPIADTEQEVVSSLGNTIELDGTNSVASDGRLLSFRWRQVFGQELAISDQNSSKLVVNVPNSITDNFLKFELIVNDGVMDSKPVYIGVSILDYFGNNINLLHSPFLFPALPKQWGNPIVAIKSDISSSLVYTVRIKSGLEVHKVVDNVRFRKISQFLGDYGSSDVELFGNFAYLVAQSAITILDISDPLQPTLLNKFSPSTGSYIFELDALLKLGVVTSGTTVKIYDFKSPANPTEIGGFISTVSYITRILFENGLIYIIGKDKMEIYSLVAPHSPQAPGLLGGYTYIGDPGETLFSEDSVLEGNYLYSSFNNDGIHVINVADPNNPYLAKRYLQAQTGYGALAVKNQILFADHSNRGILQIDFGDLQNVKMLTPSPQEFFPINYLFSMVQYGESLLVSDGNLYLFDAKFPYDQPALVSTASSGIVDISISGSDLISINNLGNVQKFDISNSSNIIPGDIILTSPGTSKILSENSRLYQTSNAPALKFNIYNTNAAPISLIGSYTINSSSVSNSITDMLLVNSSVFIADSGNGLSVLKIAADNSISQIGKYSENGFLPDKVDASGSLIAVANDTSVRVLDTAGIDSGQTLIPTMVTLADATYKITDINFNNKIVYLGNNGGLIGTEFIGNEKGQGIEALLLINSKLEQLYQLRLPGITSNIEILKDNLIVSQSKLNLSGSKGGVHIYDISNSAAPLLKARFWSKNTEDVTATKLVGDNLYIADKKFGLQKMPINLQLNRKFGISDIIPGGKITYDLIWPQLANKYDVKCFVSAGACNVVVNVQNNSANLIWTLPQAVSKSYKLRAAVGNYSYFLSESDKVQLP